MVHERAHERWRQLSGHRASVSFYLQKICSKDGNIEDCINLLSILD